jgi:hypothetical protein
MWFHKIKYDKYKKIDLLRLGLIEYLRNIIIWMEYIEARIERKLNS